MIAERIEALLPLVEKPARYLGTEIGVLRKRRRDQVAWLLILPDVYEIGMSHQGLRILYDILHRREDALAERAFAPWTDMEALMRREGIPLFSLESRTPAREFDLVGFSLQYELLGSNVLNLLDLGGIPLRSRDRGEDDPLVVAGGPCTGNPEPLADFIDFFLIGDGEDLVGRITSTVAEMRGRPRAERLLALARLPGVYVPRFYEPIYRGGRQVAVSPVAEVPPRIVRTFVRDLDRAGYPERPLVPIIEAVQDRLTLEIQRGCTHGCRFCQAGIFYRPVRERSPESLITQIGHGLPATGWDEISLSSLSSADYSRIRPLTRTLMSVLGPEHIGLSFSSLRVDTFSVELAELVSQVRKTGFTFAPEAGSGRLRDVINKRVSDSDLIRSVEATFSRGWRRVKLYFMIGLPTETEQDVRAIATLSERVLAVGRRHTKRAQVTISVGSFVPKAHTPFQWEAFAGREALHAKLRLLKAHTRRRGLQLKWHDPESSYLEAVFSRGDRRLGEVLLRAWEKGGRFDGWSDHFSIARWEEAFRETGLDAERFTAALPPETPLPWDHIDLGTTKAFLLRERERSHSGELSPDCRLAPCLGCGLGCQPTPLERSRDGEDSPDWERMRTGLVAALGQGETAGGEPRRYRIVYAKTGRLRFISHLEIARLLARLLRMARWPVAFSAGHHPHPKISFGPPLPLGVEGTHELFDVQTIGPLSGGALDRLAESAPAGLDLKTVREIEGRPRSLAAAAAAAHYEVWMPEDVSRLARGERRIEQFRESGAVPVLKVSKGRQKSIDLKRCVRVLEWAGDDRLRMDLLLQEPAGHVLGPLKALAELFKWSPEDQARCRVTRTALLDDREKALHEWIDVARSPG